MTLKSKANLLASTFSDKFVLPHEQVNEYSSIVPNSDHMQCGFLPVRIRLVRKVLKNLALDSSSGPDLIASRILKKFAGILAFPIVLLSRCILRTGCWPSTWKIHWILPLYKKNPA